MVAGEEEVVVCDVETVFIDDGERVGAVDLRMDDSVQMCSGLVFGPKTEKFEAGAGLRVVDDIEGSAFAVVFDA